MNSKFKKGFTLIELLVVVAIIAILAAIVLALLGDARDKGAGGAVKSNMANALKQAEVFYATNTAVPNSYTGVCTDPGPVGGAKTIAAMMVAAGKADGIISPYFSRNAAGSVSTITCNDSATAWAAEAPLKGAGANQMWCIDSTGKSIQVNGSTLASSADTACN